MDPRAPSQQEVAAQLRQLATTRPVRTPPMSRALSRTEEVVELEAATQALRQLGYKTRAAHGALSLATRALVQSGFSATLATHAVAQACAHVGTDDLPTLVKEALRHCRE